MFYIIHSSCSSRGSNSLTCTQMYLSIYNYVYKIYIYSADRGRIQLRVELFAGCALFLNSLGMLLKSILVFFFHIYMHNVIKTKKNFSSGAYYYIYS